MNAIWTKVMRFRDQLKGRIMSFWNRLKSRTMWYWNQLKKFVQEIPLPLRALFIGVAFWPFVSFWISCLGPPNTCMDEGLNDVLPIIAWELGFAILIFALIEVRAKIRQDQARGHVHGPAFSSAIDIFGDIHHLISDVMEDSFDDERKNIIKLNEKYKESGTPWKHQLQEEVSRIYSESENYLQRFGAFLASDQTEDTGSKLLNTISYIRRILRQIDRILKMQDNRTPKDPDNREKDVRLGVQLQLKVKISAKMEASVVLLHIDGNKIDLGSLAELNELAASMKAYYRYALDTPDNKEDLNKEDLIRRDDDNILSQRDGHPLAARLDARKPYSWTRRLLENARRSLDVLFAGPEVWDFLDNKSNDAKQEPKRHSVNPKSGLRVAWYNLGLRYIEHKHALDEEDKDFAKQMITAAADAEHITAMRTLGILYHEGEFDVVIKEVNGKDKKYFTKKYLTQAADRGDAEAQIKLGVMYRKGECVEKDLEKAEELFKKAEVEGSFEARMIMAELLYCKSRTKTDWLADRKKAARENAAKMCESVRDDADSNGKLGLSARASYCLARIQQKNFDLDVRYYRPTHSENRKEAEELEKRVAALKKKAVPFLDNYRNAALFGHEGARYELGTIHLRGKIAGDMVIVPQDLNKAACWFRRVVESNNDGEHADLRTRARIELARMYVENRLSDVEIREVLKWLPTVIKKKEWEDPKAGRVALYVTGAVYRDGIYRRGRTFVEKDDAKAMKLFERAAKNGHVEAENRLGMMYRDGYHDHEGREKNDLEKAMRCFKEAAGNSKTRTEWEWVIGAARNNLGEMYARGYYKLPEDVKGQYVGVRKDFDHVIDEYIIKGEVDCDTAFRLGIEYFDDEGRGKDRQKALKFFCDAALIMQKNDGSMLDKNGLMSGYFDLDSNGKVKEIGEYPLEVCISAWDGGNLEIRRTYTGPTLGTLGRKNSDIWRTKTPWPIAEYYIGRILEQERNHKDALLFCRLAALPHSNGMPGYPGAQYKLGCMYENGWFG